MIEIETTVKKFNHNKKISSARMVKAEPHVLRFIGDGGREMHDEEIQSMFNELMENGYQFTVKTIFDEDCPYYEAV